MSELSTKQAVSSVITKTAALISVNCLCLAMLPSHTSAQIISNNDGTGTLINTVDDQLEISGGQSSSDQTNLFQSFQQFNLTADQTANFMTTPEVRNVIGNINGGNISEIQGTLQVSGSDANLYLMNPAGILIGPDAQLNIAGSFTATTATDIEFEYGQLSAIQNGDYTNLTASPTGFRFDTQQTGEVVNLGNLGVTEGKSINLIGGNLVNTGSLTAPGGTITLAAVQGENLVRISQDNQLLSLEVETSSLNSFSNNSHSQDQSLSEILTGSGLDDAAHIVMHPDGSVSLGSSTIGEEESIAIASGNISTTGDIGGTINVLGEQVSLIDAQLHADGVTGGGLIRVGGDYRGQGNVTNARSTHVNETSTLSANALSSGDGGQIIVWADDTTAFDGSLSAVGGGVDGHGGFAEVSGKQTLRFQGQADLRGGQGNFGTLLLDPENVEITDGTAQEPSASQMTSDAVETLFNTTNLVIEATNDIRIHDIIDNTLTVQPGRNITFTADSDGVGGGQVIADNITLNAEQGNVSLSGSGITVGDIQTNTTVAAANGGNVLLNSSQDISLGTINTSSNVVSTRAGMGGNVTLTASENITVGNINTQSETTKNNAQQGGDVSLTTTHGNITTGIISAYSLAGQNNSEQGGEVSLTASGDITTQDIFTYSAVGQNNAWQGGEVQLVSSGNIRAQNISTYSSAGNNNAEDGGLVSLMANEIITAQRIQTQSIASRIEQSSNGGSVNLSSSSGPIEIGFIDARGGTANTSTETTVNISGQGTFRATDAIAGNSISTLNSNNGNISIAYRTDAAIPFMVGSSSENGTTGGIETTSENLPFGSYFNNPPESSIELINGVNPPGVEPPTVELPPEPVPPVEPESEVEPPTVTPPTVAPAPEVEPPNAPTPEVEPPMVSAPDAEIAPEVEPPSTPMPEVELPVEPAPDVELTPEVEPPSTPTPEVEPPVEPEPEAELPSELTPEVEPSDELTGIEPTENRDENEPAPLPNTNTSDSSSSESMNSDSMTVGSPFILSVDEIQESQTTQSFAGLQPTSTATDNNTNLETIEQIETTISEEFKQFLGIDSQPQPVKIETIQNTLAEIEQTTGERAALIYLYFVASDEAPNTETPSTNNEASPPINPNDELEIMIVTTNEGAVRNRQQGVTREQIATVGKMLRQQTVNQFSSPRQYLPPAQQLYNWLVTPLTTKLEEENISSLGFVMDTGLRTLPMAALHDGEQFLVENYSVGLLPSFSLTDFEKGDRVNFSTAQVLAMGASEFENQPTLPAVEAEVNFIAEQLETSDVFLNEDFVLDTVQKQLSQQDYDILHMATHAAFESGDLENSYIQLWNDQLLLTELDDLQLDDSDISLIILSACNTAFGDPASEYGFAGFTVSAGTPSALASLWAVSDEGTLGFMSQFYTQLQGASTRVGALQQAQVSMLRGDIGINDGVVYGPDESVIAELPSLENSGRWDFSHPYYWSTFTMIGNPW